MPVTSPILLRAPARAQQDPPLARGANKNHLFAYLNNNNNNSNSNNSTIALSPRSSRVPLALFKFPKFTICSSLNETKVVPPSKLVEVLAVLARHGYLRLFPKTTLFAIASTNKKALRIAASHISKLHLLCFVLCFFPSYLLRIIFFFLL